MTTQADLNGSPTGELTLEQKVDTLIYLHHELALRFQAIAAAVSAMLAQQMQPQMQQAIMARLMGGEQP